MKRVFGLVLFVVFSATAACAPLPPECLRNDECKGVCVGGICTNMCSADADCDSNLACVVVTRGENLNKKVCARP